MKHTEKSRAARWLAREFPRQNVAAAGGALLAVAVVLALGMRNADLPLIVDFLGLYAVFVTFTALFYVLLTLFAFGGLRGEELRQFAADSSARSAKEERTMRFLGINEVFLAMAMGAFSLAAAVNLVVLPEYREQPWGTPSALVSIISSWVLIVVAFATRYVRAWAVHRALEFDEGLDDHLAFADFLLVSLQMSTAFSLGHARLRSPEIRLALIGHNLVAFLFNSVILALLISLALPG